jgi:hypothetical protein
VLNKQAHLETIQGILNGLSHNSFLLKGGPFFSCRYGEETKEMERMYYLEFIVRVTSHIPDKGQATVRYYGLYANAHRGKVKKAIHGAFPLRIMGEELWPSRFRVLDTGPRPGIPSFRNGKGQR